MANSSRLSEAEKLSLSVEKFQGEAVPLLFSEASKAATEYANRVSVGVKSLEPNTRAAQQQVEKELKQHAVKLGLAALDALRGNFQSDALKDTLRQILNDRTTQLRTANEELEKQQSTAADYAKVYTMGERGLEILRMAQDYHDRGLLTPPDEIPNLQRKAEVQGYQQKNPNINSPQKRECLIRLVSYANALNKQREASFAWQEASRISKSFNELQRKDTPENRSWNK